MPIEYDRKIRYNQELEEYELMEFFICQCRYCTPDADEGHWKMIGSSTTKQLLLESVDWIMYSIQRMINKGAVRGQGRLRDYPEKICKQG